MRWLPVTFVVVLLCAAMPAQAAGFQYLSIPDASAQPIDIGIWYPSNASTARTTIGQLPQVVAVDGPVTGDNLPLIVISHGSAGSFAGHHDTAQALAAAGFIVVALTHPGDNFKDVGHSGLNILIDRPQQIHHVLDYMTQAWPGREHINTSQIGFFGFSAGGFTGVVVLGGVPNWALFAPHCVANPDEPACHQGIARVLSRPATAALPETTWLHDVRIKAAVLASPGLAFSFDPSSLGRISVPVQLWGGSGDQFVPAASNIGYLQRFLRHVTDVQIVPGATHYSFLAPCSDAMRAAVPEICTDSPGFDRASFHETFDKSVVAFFQAELMPH